MRIVVTYRNGNDPQEEPMPIRYAEAKGISQRVLSQIGQPAQTGDSVITASRLGAVYLNGLLSRYLREGDSPLFSVYVQIDKGDFHGTKNLDPGVGAYLEYRIRARHGADLPTDDFWREQLIGEAADMLEQVLDAELPPLRVAVEEEPK